MRFIRRALLGAVLLVALVAGGVFALSSYRMSRRIAVHDSEPVIRTDSASIARGRHLAIAIAKCVDCHGADLGGQLAVDAGPIGQLIAPNITSGAGGVLSALSDAELVRAIRHGVRPDGTPLRFMPTTSFNLLSDEDVAAIVAYLRAAPPVDRPSRGSVVRPLGRLLYVAGQLPLMNESELVPHDGITRRTPPAGATAEYGAYLATVGGCTGCHGPGLSGGHVPGTPPSFKPAANLTPSGIGQWSEQDFVTALREGKRPDGSVIDPFMPVKYTAQMTDDELRALYAHLRTVPPRETGTR
ncbi:MAG TPA: cytochrome c [Gemmatimonadaceae bacterium]|nr:cytochrome c [Gemmatimonadaceae bacterium]